MAQTLNINQQAMFALIGQIDIHTQANGVITAIVDSTQASALKTGQYVKLVTTNTGPLPKVVAAGQTDVANGLIVFQPKGSSFVANDRVDIMFFGGNIVWMQATAVAIVPGAQVESDSTGLLIQASSGNKVRGVALDYFPASGTGRMIQLGYLNAN